ncbi:Multifunctional cytochrome P450 monooxygenase, partial [Pseudocercospora fuligena]
VPLASLGLILLVVQWLRLRTPRLRLPPGPKPFPMLGNINDLPPKVGRDWEFWYQHKQLYGPISSVTVFGTTIVILNDLEVATELLEKQSNASLNRPHMNFLMGLCGWAHVVSLLSNGHRLRASRKHFHSVMGTQQNLPRFLPLQEAESHRLLLRTLKQPNSFLKHIRTEVGSIILKLAYGYTAATDQPDPLIELSNLTHRHAGIGAQPGVWAVDFIPALKYVPDWFPGAGFQRTAKEFRAKIMEAVYRPAKFVEHEMEKGANEPSFLSVVHEQAGEKLSAEEQDIATYSAHSLYGGASDTTVSTLSTFFLMMVLHPEIQRKAQAEVDSSVGTARLPGIEHRDRLPYLQAIIKEVLRFHPVAPTGLPHLMATDATCAGYDIPKGAMVIANLWGIGRDTSIYTDPHLFRPERFLGDRPELDSRTWAFGFGRRACPGKLLAEQTIFLTIARVLAVFDISKPDAEEEPAVRFEPGMVSQPEPFQASIKPRSPECERLIERAEKMYPLQQSSADTLRDITKW